MQKTDQKTFRPCPQMPTLPESFLLFLFPLRASGQCIRWLWFEPWPRCDEAIPNLKRRTGLLLQNRPAENANVPLSHMFSWINPLFLPKNPELNPLLREDFPPQPLLSLKMRRPPTISIPLRCTRGRMEPPLSLDKGEFQQLGEVIFGADTNGE